MYSITLLPDSNSYYSCSIEQRFDTDSAFFRALYRVAKAHNCLGNDLDYTIKFLSNVGYIISLPKH